MKRLDGIACIEWRVQINENNDRKLKWLFEAIDTDGSGDIDVKELRNAFNDKDLRKEMGGLLTETADALFENMDENRSGAIDWDEFSSYFHNKNYDLPESKD